MRIVIDTNIAFSAILNTNSRIARIILHPKTRFNFYSTKQLLSEIQEHKEKIIYKNDLEIVSLKEVKTNFIEEVKELKSKATTLKKELQKTKRVSRSFI